MGAPLPPSAALTRRGRTATLVASLVAVIELVLLVGAAAMLLAKPLAHAVQRHAEASVLAPATTSTKKAQAIVHRIKRVPPAKHTRSHTGVFVLNGNGRNGAASAEASKLSALGYRVPGKGNAKRTDYATTVVMYRRGWEAEGRRLASDLHVKVVGPLDGMSTSALHGAQTVVVLGAR